MKIIYSLIIFILSSCKVPTIESLHLDSINNFYTKIDSVKVLPSLIESIKNSHPQTNLSSVTTYKFVNDSIVFPDTLLVGKIIYVEHTKDIDKILEYVFPIIMLLLGIVLDRTVLYISEKLRIKKAGKLWMIEVNNLTYSLNNQIKSFDSFISSYCNITDAFDVPSIPKYESLKCEIFNSLQKNDLYDYLKTNTSPKENFHKILNIISTTKDTYEQTINYLNKSMEISSQCVDHFNQYLRSYIQELNLNEEIYRKYLDSDLDTLLELYNTEIVQKMYKVNIFIIQHSFVDKSISILEKHNRRLCENLLRPLFNIQDNIQALRNEKEYCRQNLAQSIQLFNAVLENISSLTNLKEQ